MSKQLPERANLDHLKKQAKDLLTSLARQDPETLKAVSQYFPSQHQIGLNDAQLVIAREYGFESWAKLKAHVEQTTKSVAQRFIEAVQEDGAKAKELWQSHQNTLATELSCAVAAGQVEALESLSITEVQKNHPPQQWPLLAYACMSKLANDPDFQAGAVATVRKLLALGAEPNAKFWVEDANGRFQLPVLYGVAGFLNNTALTKLLLDSGASPDDEESLFHASEHPGNNKCVRLLLEANPSQSTKDHSFKRMLDFENLEGLSLYLEHGTNPNAATPRTALSHAIYAHRSIDAIRFLLDHGADPNVPDQDGDLPYASAARQNDGELMRLLAARGASTDLSDEDQLLFLVAQGDVASVEKILAEHPGLKERFTPRELPNDGYFKPFRPHEQMMFDMARQGNVPSLKVLVALGVDPAMKSAGDVMPIHFACIAGRPGAVRFLLEQGVSADASETQHNSNPMGWALFGSMYENAVSSDYAETVRVLLEAGASRPEHIWGSDEVKAVLEQNDEQFLKLVLEGQVEEAAQLWKTSRDSLRKNVACALRAGDVEAVREAIEADPELPSKNLPPYDQPALLYPCFSKLVEREEFEKGILETAHLLLQSGADPNAFRWGNWNGEKYREMALYGAAGVLNHPGLTKLLLDAGADPDDQSVDGNTYSGESLYHACEHPGKNECVRLILEAGASQPAKDYCLKRKLDFEDEEGALIFLRYGANPNNPKPRTALSHAVLRGRSPRMIRLLLANGADPNVVDADGMRAYSTAKRFGYAEIAQILEEAGANTTLGIHDQVLAAAAEGDSSKVRELAAQHPEAIRQITEIGRQADGTGFPGGMSGHTLHDMARLGHVEAIKALLDIGMAVDTRNHYQETPLHWASLAGRVEAAKLLLKRGAPIDALDVNHKSTPLGWAIWGSLFWNEEHGDYAETVRALLAAGAPLPETVGGSEAVQAVLREQASLETTPSAEA